MKNLFALPVCVFLFVSCEQNTVSVVEKPSQKQINKNYISNRPPLLPSALIKLPIGAVKPRGWLKEILVRQKNGLAGNLHKISAWLQKDDNAWLSKEGKGKWGWEEMPYWLKGYGNIAYIFKDPKMIAEAKIWIKGALQSQQENGDFGPRRNDWSSGNRDYWGNMIMLYCLQSYYEYSKDKRILALMTRYFKYQMSVPDENFLKGYWQKVRGGDNLHSVLWLYNRTGDTFLLELMKKINRNTSDWTSRGHKKSKIKSRQHVRKGFEWPEWQGDQIDWHNVNHAQCFRQPAQYYLLNKNIKYLNAAYENFNMVRKYYGQVPGGMFGGDENCRPGYEDPRQAIETCGIVEQMNSDQHMLRITGDTFWADHCEEISFNTYPAALTKDLKKLRYLTAPNMVVSDRKNYHPSVDNRGPFTLMNPLSHRCCQHNHSQGWPYLVENLWMATPDNGLCAAIYAASEVSALVAEGQPVSIVEQTQYPFEDTIVFKIQTKKQVSFPLYLRVPSWCQNASIFINNEKVAVKISPSKYIKIKRTWQHNDKVRLKLPMSIRTKKYVRNRNAMSVHYGALAFSLKIKEIYKKIDATTSAVSDAKWQKNVDTKKWNAVEINAGSPWNYGLDLKKNSSDSFIIKKRPWPKDNYPFTHDATPIYVIATGRRIDTWNLDSKGFTGELPYSPVKSDQPKEKITLIPMGAARLRISAFPVIAREK